MIVSPVTQGGSYPDDEARIADLQARFLPLGLPESPNYNPSEADPETLKRIGLPPRPDSSQPELYSRWMATFGRELAFVPFTLSVDAVLGADYRPFFRRNSYGSAIPFSAGGRIRASQNWSGAFVEPQAGRTFVQVWGRFTVPTAKPPLGAALPAPGSTNEYECATWIGLDGQRRYRNSSLPQIGTLQAVTVDSNGSETLVTEAWVQWWARDDDGTVNGIGPVPIPTASFPVAPTNDIACVMTLLNEHFVLFNIVNLSETPPKMMAIIGEAPTVTLPGGAKLKYSVTGATAEWIMECPTILGSNVLRKFAAYAPVNFIDCFAVEAFKQAAPAVVRALESPRFIRMYEIKPNPPRIAITSMPSRIDNTSFKVAYGGFP